MLVYGDHRERADPSERLRLISERLQLVADLPPGIDRHAQLVSALIEAGQLLQGIADEGLPANDPSDFVHELARSVVRSWDSRFADVGELPPVPRHTSPKSVELRLPEGFAFYAVYPEAYVKAARRLKLVGRPRVIGIRSIGTTLGAVVAAALGAAPALTVRPFGDPFARQVELPPEALERDAHYVIVDEGPGLSGSSFGAVADWLAARGVALERIAFLPSHLGDLGPHASDAHRLRWKAAQRIAAEFDASFLQQRFGALQELTSGGAWRRKKFLATQGGTRVLLKFAGLGAVGERKLEMARALHAAGFSPEPFALVRGFLAEHWCEDAQPLGPDDKPVDEIGRYIGARARLFPASPDSGASIDELLTMCRRNIGLAVGDEFASKVDRFDAEALPRRVTRVRTDNKMQPEEWLRLNDGRLLKTDALDHHRAHDLIGCQGLEWDVAGAIEEFALGPGEASRLIDAVGTNVDPDLLAFYRAAYAAFRLGYSELAGDRPARDRYTASVRLLLHQNSCAAANRGESPFDCAPERTGTGTNPLLLGS